MQHATRLMTREIISAELQDQVFAAQFLNFAQCGAVSVHHLLSIIISGRKINMTASELTRNFNWDCLYKLVSRTQETAEQNPENAKQIAYDAGLTCDWRINDRGLFRPFVYWVPRNGMTLYSFN